MAAAAAAAVSGAGGIGCSAGPGGFAGRGLRIRAPLSSSISKGQPRHARGALRVSSQFKLVPEGGGGAVDVAKESVVGSGGKADIRISSPSVSEEHAKLSLAGTRYFCTDLESDEGTFFNGNKLCPGVQYLLAPGSTLAFGDETYTVEYEEEAGAGSDAMAKMLMQGMLTGADDEVRKAVDENL